MTMHRPRRGATALGVAFALIALAACGGAAPPVSTEPPTTTAPSTQPSPEPSGSASSAPSASAGASLATTGRVVLADQGFAVTLPDGWTRIDLESGDIDALVAAAGAENPALTEIYSQQIRAMLAQGLVLFAFGPNPTSGTNLNILSAPNMGLGLDFLEQANLAQLEALADGQVASERVTLPAGEALHLQYAIAVSSGTASPTVDQYLLINGTRQLVVSVTNAPAGDAAAIAQSIELLD